MKIELAQHKPFEFVSDAPASFPPACARCGKPTKKFMAVKVSAGRPSFVGDFLRGMFVGRLVHVLHGLQALKAGSVGIPCCSACRSPYYWGNFLALVCLVGGGAGFYFSLNSNLPLWALYLTVIPSIVCFFLWMIPHSVGKCKALPAIVWLEENRYHYLFFSKAFQEVLSKALNNPQAVPPRLPKSEKVV